jgi:hypothetical protein
MKVLILIPVDSEEGLHAKITTLASVKKWALIDFEDGILKMTRFFDERTQTGEDWIDFIILENKFENYIDFMGEGMMCLVKRGEETIDELISAFRFKELDEIGL